MEVTDSPAVVVVATSSNVLGDSVVVTRPIASGGSVWPSPSSPFESSPSVALLGISRSCVSFPDRSTSNCAT